MTMSQTNMENQISSFFEKIKNSYMKYKSYVVIVIKELLPLFPNTYLQQKKLTWAMHV